MMPCVMYGNQARAELAEERKKGPSPESEREHAALIQQVQELNNLKDAIAHLRQVSRDTWRGGTLPDLHHTSIMSDYHPNRRRIRQMPDCERERKK